MFRGFRKEPEPESEPGSESEKTPKWVKDDITTAKRKKGTENYDLTKRKIINTLKSSYFLKKRYSDYSQYNTRDYHFYTSPEKGDQLLLDTVAPPNGRTYGMVLKGLQGEITKGTRQQICFDAVAFMLLSEKIAAADGMLSEARKYSAIVNDIAYVNDGQQFYDIQDYVKSLDDAEVEPEISKEGGKKTRKNKKHRKSKKPRKSHKKRNKSHRKK